ncbi:MAG TPA: hypothetical protein DCS93_12520 [Microscillaceae bacterium]|nr:hypothetical protein [Microscillaceae bacterium]
MESKFFAIREYISSIDDFILLLILLVVLNGVVIWSFNSWRQCILNLRQRKWKNVIFYFWLSLLLGAMSLPWYIFIFLPHMLGVLLSILIAILTYRAAKEPIASSPKTSASTDLPLLDIYSYAPPALPQPMPQQAVPISKLMALEKKANVLWKNYSNNDENYFWKKYEQLLEKSLNQSK